MSNTELLAFAFVLSIGLYLYFKARRFGESQKDNFESEAFARMRRNLNKLEGGKQSYEYFTRKASSSAEWRQVDLSTMEEDIVSDCTRSTPEGDLYGKARYAMRSDSNSKRVFYVTGVAGYAFTDIER